MNDKKIKEIIKNGKEYLMHNDMKGFYNYLDTIVKKGDEISSITTWFLKHGINPLDYMNYIPHDFLALSKIEAFEIPENIEKIDAYAFAFCRNLTDINVPKNLKTVHKDAFLKCPEETQEKFKGFI